MVKVFRFAGLFFVQSLLCVGFQRITALRAISLIGLRGKGSENQVMMVMLVQGKCRLLPQRPLVVAMSHHREAAVAGITPVC